MAEPAYLTVFGHEELRQRIARAIAQGRLPQSLLLHGPRGVGKQRLAIWTAAALNCSGDSPGPCGACLACRLAGRLEHPDIHWFFPGPRPTGASSPQRLEQKLEDQRAAALEDRRANPRYLEEEEGATGIYLGAVKTMRRLIQKPPAMGPAKVLVIGQAEALVPQTSSPEAANALLKLLEEPPADTTLILTSAVPGALLSTVRSRVQPIRVAPLPKDRVREFLETQLGLPASDAAPLAERSAGSIGLALEFREEGHDQLQREALELVRTVLDPREATRLAAAHRYRAFGARGAFGRVLDESRALLRDLLATSAGASGAASDPATVSALAGDALPGPLQIIRVLEAVDQARELADRNVNPQLIVANLLRFGAGAGRSTAGAGGPRGDART